jgi:predicted phage tail protein
MYQVTCLVPVWVRNSSLLRVNEFLTVRPVRYPVDAGWHQAGMTHLLHSAVVSRSIATVVAVGSATAASVAFVVMVGIGLWLGLVSVFLSRAKHGAGVSIKSESHWKTLNLGSKPPTETV